MTLVEVPASPFTGTSGGVARVGSVAVPAVPAASASVGAVAGGAETPGVGVTGASSGGVGHTHVNFCGRGGRGGGQDRELSAAAGQQQAPPRLQAAGRLGFVLLLRLPRPGGPPRHQPSQPAAPTLPSLHTTGLVSTKNSSCSEATVRVV